jgi:hypothetical protein
MHAGADWNAAPKDVFWWAVDADGSARWFKSPEVAPFATFWFADEERAPLFGYTGEWRESLTMRPTR